RGALYHQRGEEALAVAEYQRALDLRPDHWQTRFGLGLSYEKLGMRQKAIRSFRGVLRWNPSMQTARRHLEALENEP
ncbi:MAG: tetratricopeptide repeat protein, partial [Acidobacteriota bacterium]